MNVRMATGSPGLGASASTVGASPQNTVKTTTATLCDVKTGRVTNGINKFLLFASIYFELQCFYSNLG